MDKMLRRPQTLGEVSSCEAERLSIREQLETKKSRLLSEIAKLDEALKALNSNPGFEQCFDLVGRAI